MQNVRRLGWFAASASMLLLVGTSYAQTSGSMSSGQRGSMGSSAQNSPGTSGQNNTMGGAPTGGPGRSADASQSMDHAFIMKAAEGGLAEVQLGQLAQQNAQSQDVKDFGQRMVTDHTKANDDLKQVAQQEGITVPTELKGHEKAEYDRLSKLHGDAFDKAYSKLMVTDHKKDVAEFQREANSGSDPQVKSFASQTLPTLQEHLQMAEKLNGAGQSSAGHSASSSGKSTTQPQ